jgi:hypothetical protein
MTPATACWSAALLALVAAGCGQASVDEARRVDLRDRSRLVLEAHCGTCHLPWLDTSLDWALNVFDLSEEEWASRMDERQRLDVVNRLTRDRAPGADGDGARMTVPEAEQALVKAFLETEDSR